MTMFIMNLSSSVRVGDTVDVRINGKPARVTLHANALVIEPGDRREIVRIIHEGDQNSFVCADGDGSTDFIINGEKVGKWADEN
jgi:hypothetical protein